MQQMMQEMMLLLLALSSGAKSIKFNLKDSSGNTQLILRVSFHFLLKKVMLKTKSLPN